MPLPGDGCAPCPRPRRDSLSPQPSVQALRERTEQLSLRSGACAVQLEHAQSLLTQFSEALEELLPWLEETQALGVQLSPNAISYEAFKEQQALLQVWAGQGQKGLARRVGSGEVTRWGWHRHMGTIGLGHPTNRSPQGAAAHIPVGCVGAMPREIFHPSSPPRLFPPPEPAGGHCRAPAAGGEAAASVGAAAGAEPRAGSAVPAALAGAGGAVRSHPRACAPGGGSAGGRPAPIQPGMGPAVRPYSRICGWHCHTARYGAGIATI